MESNASYPSIYLSRSWTEYKDGFGDMDAEFWLGNDNLHYITTQGQYCFRKPFTKFYILKLL